MVKTFRETKVVSRNAITDWVQSIRNMLGLPLIAYANIINNTCEELEKKYLIKEIKWFRFDIEQTNNNAFVITIYGEYK